tara:strand:- start:237 stop:425 length:189 start_codon:yes stop_codon:yes gene_type:complete
MICECGHRMRGKLVCPMGLCFVHEHADGTTHIHKAGDIPHEHGEENMLKRIWKKIKGWIGLV